MKERIEILTMLGLSEQQACNFCKNLFTEGVISSVHINNTKAVEEIYKYFDELVKQS